MRRVDTGDPRRLEYRGGGGPLAVLGLIFLGIGVALGAVGVQKEQLPVLLGAGFFLVLGIFTVLTRSGLEFDLDARRYRSWWGLPFPIVVREGAIDAGARVSLSREIRRAKNNTYTVFPVRLEAGRRFTFATPRSYEKARLEAEIVAKMLGLPLADRGTGEEILREPDRLDESLRDRAAREGGLVDPGDPPPGMLSRIETEGRTIRIHMPPRGFTPRLLAFFAPLAAFDVVFIFLLFGFLREAGGELRWPIILMAVFFLVLPVVIVVSVVTRRARALSTVEASPEVLRVTFGSGGREKVVEISSESLEDLEIAKAREAHTPGGVAGGSGLPIVARSDQARISFGEHLPEAEKAWILRVLKQVLTA